MKVEALIGTQQIKPFPCPKCGHLFEQYAGVPTPGATPVAKVEPRRLLLMVCERCESAIARVDDMMLVLGKEQEQQLPQHAQDGINQARKLVQAKKP